MFLFSAFERALLLNKLCQQTEERSSGKKPTHNPNFDPPLKVVHGDCGVSVLKDTQKLSRHGPEKTALGGSPAARRLYEMTSRGPF